MGYTNLMCEAQRPGRRWFSYHPPCLTDLGLNVNGAGSEAMKMQRQDIVLVPARATQMPAAAVVWRLRNVDVFA